MADEIYSGDVLVYTVSSDNPITFGQWSFPVVSHIAKMVASTTDLVSWRNGNNFFTLTLRSKMNRASASDLKGDLDRAVGAEPNIITDGVGTDLAFKSKVKRPSTSTPSTGGSGAGGNKNQEQPKKGDFLDEIAKQLGVKKDTLIWGAAGLALLLMLKK